MAGPFQIPPKQGSATSFLGINLLVCESLVPEPTGGVCRILCGPNVPTLISCHPGVGFDTPLVTIWNIVYGPRHGLDKLWVRSIGAVMNLDTSTSCPGVNSRMGGNLELLAFCFSTRSDKFLRANSKQDL